MNATNQRQLPHVDEVAPRSERDSVLFRELSEVLARHGALDRFGITLLHKHFDLADDEVMLEETDVPRRTHRIKPVKHAVIAAEECLETAWQLGPEGAVALRCVCKKIKGEHAGHIFTT